MICVKISGGLGNQLFQYAFGRALSKELNEELYLDISEYTFQGNVRKFELGNFKIPFKLISERKIAGAFFMRYPSANYLLSSIYNRLFRKINVISENNNTKNITPSQQIIKSKLNLFDGYWQSEAYFKNISDSLKNEILLKKKIDPELENIFSLQKTIVIQIRRGDYLTLAKDSEGRTIVLSIDYYKKIIAKITDLDNYTIYIISDEPKRIRQEWEELPSNAIICNNDQYTDLWMISNADICVISNSSFGWWGAYLNKKINKTVYIPKYWFGFHEQKWIPENIEIPEWNSINVFN